MAWSWSHTAEAYRDAELNLQDLPLEELQVIYAEWKSTEWDEEPSFAIAEFNADKYPAMLEEARDNLPADILADAIWNWASDQQTCDNGGYNAWVCPYGCHTVPFDRNEEDEN